MLNIVEWYSQRGLQAKSKGNNARGREFAGPCPACGGRDRFCLWPDQGQAGTYFCRECRRAGDMLQALMDFDGLSFHEACRAAGRDAQPSPRKACPTLPTAPAEKKRIATAPCKEASEQWREKADAFCSWCTEQLLAAPQQLAYLAARGLPLDAVLTYRLGWNAGDRGRDCLMRPRSVWGLPDGEPSSKGGRPRKALWLPRGIVVPQLGNDGRVMRLRIRRPEQDRAKSLPNMKYYVVPGSGMSPLWLPQKPGILPEGLCVLIVETELDAMMLHYHCGDVCAVLGAMTAKVRHLPPRIMENLRHAAQLQIALDKGDASRAGEEGSALWLESFPQAIRNPPSGAKDPGEMAERGADMLLWVLRAMPPIYAAAAYNKLRCAPSAERAEAQAAQGSTQQPRQATEAASHAEPSYAASNHAEPSQPQPVPCPEQGTRAEAGAKDEAEAGAKTRAEEARAAISNPEDLKKIYPLSGWYMGDPAFVRFVLEVHGFFLEPKGDDFVLRGAEHLRGQRVTELLSFCCRHDRALSILNAQLHQKEQQA